MPFKGLTWFRLKEHIRKTFWIYIFGIAVMAFLTNLLYTMTAPRVPAEFEVLVYMVDDYSTVEAPAINDLCQEALAYGRETDETLQLVRFESIGYQGVEDYASPMLMTARMSIGDGDVYLCSPAGFDYICKSGLPIDLREHLDNGWLSELNAETYEWHYEETGDTIVAGVSLANVPMLDKMCLFDVTDAYLVVAGNSNNVETSMNVAEHLLYRMAGIIEAPAATEVNSDASADSEEPAA